VTKSELVDAVASKLPTMLRGDVELGVRTVFTAMAEALLDEERIEIRGFGSFTVRHRKARDGRNPGPARRCGSCTGAPCTSPSARSCWSASTPGAASRPTASAASGRTGRTSMSLSHWYFVRSQQDVLRPLSQAAVVRFFFNGGQLAAEADGFVRYIEVTVRLENRRAVEVQRVNAFQYCVRPDGTLDMDHLFAVTALAAEAAFGQLLRTAPRPGVIAAGHRFAKRRLEHEAGREPTEDEFAALAELVNRRAGRRIM